MRKTCLLSLALTLWSAVAMAQPSAATPIPETKPDSVERSIVAIGKLAEPGEYWLGIGCGPVPPALRAQLDLPEKQGLLVGAVVPDSPAAKAGILRNDVLLRAGDKALSEPRDLVQAIEAVKESILKIELLRDGKQTSVEATPTKRPEDLAAWSGVMPQFGDQQTMGMFQRWLEGMSPKGEADGRQPPMRFRIVHPGAIVPRDTLAPTPLPLNMSIVVSREGDQPAKIVVKRGDEKWELTEKDIDKLPADVRPHVERMLGHGVFGIVGGRPTIDFVPDMTSPDEKFRMPIFPGPGKSSHGADLLEQMDKRFEEMNRRMDKLFQAIDAMSEDHFRQAAPAAPPDQQ